MKDDLKKISIGRQPQPKISNGRRPEHEFQMENNFKLCHMEDDLSFFPMEYDLIFFSKGR